MARRGGHEMRKSLRTRSFGIDIILPDDKATRETSKVSYVVLMQLNTIQALSTRGLSSKPMKTIPVKLRLNYLTGSGVVSLNEYMAFQRAWRVGARDAVFKVNITMDVF